MALSEKQQAELDSLQAEHEAKLKALNKQHSKQLDALSDLHGLLQPGSTIWAIERHTSQSGMSHWFDFYTIKNDELLRLTYQICMACYYKDDARHGYALKTSGCGMDMAFQVVYNLGQAMWPDGTPEPHGSRNGEPDTCGGYALKLRHL